MLHRATLLLLLALSFAAALPVAAHPAPRIFAAFNQSWQFRKAADTTITAALFAPKTGQWATVSLPHTPQIEPVVTDKIQWQGNCIYRRFFRVPGGPGLRVAVEFGAAMHTADVYLNGQRVLRHVGGYLPFTVDLTRLMKYGQTNCLLVRLNNEDNATVPPGKPIKGLDFNFYGGLYRPTRLITSELLHIADAVQAGRPAGGGLLVHYENVSPQAATLHVQTEVQNDAPQAQTVQVRALLWYTDKFRMVASTTTTPVTVAPGASGRVALQLTIAPPRLWSPEQPYLYRLVVEVLRNGKVVDRQITPTGIRSIRFAAKTFTLNGQPLRLRGTNRHQEYPYLGYAISNNAQYRDAWKIKEAGFNFVRCSHYPPSPAFLDACDELGLLVMDSAPGWQFFGNEEFAQHSLRNIRDMVRRDRNHPSVVLWEAALNETDMPKPFMEAAHRAVHEELPFADNVYTCGWLDYAYDVFIPARQHLKAPDYFNTYAQNKPLFLCEYGDWEYYAHNAGFNQTAFAGLKESERTSRQLRGQGERALAQQALNFQEAHNDNFRGPAVGDANWLMFDYKRGYAPDIEASGIADIFRLPKFATYFYQSQYGPLPASPNGFGQPMVYIANYWQATSSKQVTVYSNCDEVELQLNGKTVARQKPDQNALSDHLAHPPFTFAVPAYVPGTLKAVAYRNGQPAAATERRTPGAAHHLVLTYDRSGRPAGPQDVVFVYASVVDASGTVLPEATAAIRFAVRGNAELIGDNSVRAEAGIAPTLLKTGAGKGVVQVLATAEGLPTATLKLEIH